MSIHSARFMSWAVGRNILRNMAGLTVVILAIYFGSLARGYELDNARTAAFAAWLLGHIVLALNVKQERVSLIERGLFSNRVGIGGLIGMVVFVLAMAFVPFARAILDTTPLGGRQWIAVVAGAVLASSWMAVRNAITAQAINGLPTLKRPYGTKKLVP